MVLTIASSNTIFAAGAIKIENGSGIDATGLSAGGQYAGQALTLVHQKADGSIEYSHVTADASGNVRFSPLYELSPFIVGKEYPGSYGSDGHPQGRR